jgi:hypothetical protein
VGTKSALALRYSYKPTYASLAGGFVVHTEELRFAPNSALLTDTYTSPLRAQHGAAKRGR